jgi:hypothetical protein
MKTSIKTDAVFAASGDVVVRLVENEMVLFSVAPCEDEADNEPYFLNTTGETIWRKLDGRKKLKDIVKALAAEFNMPAKVIEKDVIGFVERLMKRRLIIEVSKV